jgi:glucosamine--fructose-6-phosphate aminotransferase (isomerizing)
MNTFLKDILDQPATLRNVLEHFSPFSQFDSANDLANAALVLKSARRIVLTSMGSAYFSLMPMAEALGCIHPCVHLIETAELMKQAPFPNTTYLMMSRSGESAEIAAFAKMIKERGDPLLAITMTPESTLARLATWVLHDPASYDGFICTKAYTSMALTGLLLVSQMENALTSQLVANLQSAFQWLEQSKLNLLEQVKSIPWLGNSLTFFSQGAGMGLAMSGALWIAEGARLRADFSSVAQFRHGPVEQVDDAFNGVWIDLDGDKFARRYIEFMIEKGARIFAICSDGDPATEMAIPSFNLPPQYRVIMAAMPVQMIAYCSGVCKGHEPGEMRYLSWVIQ